MRLSECIFTLQEMAAASRDHLEKNPMEAGIAQIMLTQAFALEMAAAKLTKLLPRNEQDELVTKKDAN